MFRLHPHAIGVFVTVISIMTLGSYGCSDAPPTEAGDLRTLTPGSGPVWSSFPWRTDAAATPAVEMRLALELGYGGAPIPGQLLTTVTDLELTVTGPRSAAVVVGAVDVETDDSNPERAALIRADFDTQSPEGLTATLYAGGVGERSRVSFETPRGAAGAVRQVLENLELGLGLLLVPWPEDDTRPGATWSRTRDVEVAGIRLVESTTYELESVANESATVALEGTLVGTTAEIAFAGLPPGARCVVHEVSATIRGALVLAPGAPLPTGGDLTLELRLTADVTHEGETKPLDGRLILRIIPR